MATTDSIGEKTDRLESIIDQLENGDVSLQRAKELHEEGKELLSELEVDLDTDEGETFEQS